MTAWLRLVTAAPFIVLIGLRTKGTSLFRMTPRTYLLLAVIGLLMFGYQFFYLESIAEIGVTVSTLVSLCSIPIMVAALSAFFFRERLGGPAWVSLVLAITGTALLVANTSEQETAVGSLSLGLLFALISAAGAAAFTLGSRAANRRSDPVQVLTGTFLGAIVFLSPVPATTGLPLDVSVGGWLLLLYLGVVTQGGAFLCFQRGLETETATTASIITLIEPLVAAILAWLFFDERLGSEGWVGAALLMGALLLLTVATARKGDETDVASAPAA